MQFRSVSTQGLYMGRLNKGDDLLDQLTAACTERQVTLGRVQAIGAVQNARIGFYDQQSREYRFVTLDGAMEIAHLQGNVSLKDGAPFVHAHVTLAGADGACHGGHLASGTRVFACEFTIEAFDGPRFERRPDKETGLALWPLSAPGG